MLSPIEGLRFALAADTSAFPVEADKPARTSAGMAAAYPRVFPFSPLPAARTCQRHRLRRRDDAPALKASKGIPANPGGHA